MAGVIELNLDAVYDYVARQSSKAVMQATAYAKDKAKQHAPVRKIFKGTTYRTGKAGFRQPVLRRVVGEDEHRVGHPNSSIPLFRIRRPGGRTQFISGDFRRLNVRTGQLAKIGAGHKASTIGEQSPLIFGRHVGTSFETEGSQTLSELAVFNRVKGGKVTKVDASKLQSVSAETQLSSRGGYEVRSGRANYREPTLGGAASSRIVHVGGRLKGEIHVEGPVIEDGIIWGYVVSATKDPETGRLYPRDQEFGTVHHPPHPFLRPALHESRGPLRRFVREAIRIGSQKR